MSNWPTREAAAELLGVSLATLDRWVAAGKLASARRPRRGKRPAIVVDPSDVERLRAPPPAHPGYVTAAATPAATGVELAVREPGAAVGLPGVGPEMLTLVAAIARAVARPSEPEKFLTLEQAAELTGLSVTFLRKRIREGMLRAVRDGAVKVRKSDLAGL